MNKNILNLNIMFFYGIYFFKITIIKFLIYTIEVESTSTKKLVSDAENIKKFLQNKSIDKHENCEKEKYMEIILDEIFTNEINIEDILTKTTTLPENLSDMYHDNFSSDNINISLEDDKAKRKIGHDIISNIKDLLGIKNEPSTNIYFSFIPVKKYTGKWFIKALKRCNEYETPDKNFYYARISDICSEYDQGFDRSIDFIDEFLIFSLKYIKNKGEIELKDFIEGGLCPSIIFSRDVKKTEISGAKVNSTDVKSENSLVFDDEMPLRENYEIDLGYKISLKMIYDEKDSKIYDIEPLDFCLITDGSFNPEHYDLIREKFMGDIETIFSSQEKLFKQFFSFFENEIEVGHIDRIYCLLNADDGIFKNDIASVKEEFDYERIKNFLDQRFNIQFDSIYFYGETPEKRKKLDEIQILINFFKLIDGDIWKKYIRKCKDLCTKKSDSYVILALETKNYKNYSRIIDKILSKMNNIEARLSMQNFSNNIKKQNLILRYIYERNPIYDYYRDETNKKNSLLSCYKIYENKIYEELSFEVISAGIHLNEDLISLKISEKFPNLDMKIKPNDCTSFWNNEWVLIIHRKKFFITKKFFILVKSPRIEIYMNIDIMKFFESKLKLFISKSPVRNIHRNHRITIFGVADFGFSNFVNNINYYKNIYIPFTSRNDIYIFFLVNLIQFFKKEQLTICSFYMSNNSNIFENRSEFIDKITELNITENEFISFNKECYSEAKNHLFLADEWNTLWVSSKIEFLFDFKSNQNEILRCVYRLSTGKYYDHDQIVRFLFQNTKKLLSDILNQNFNMYWVRLLNIAIVLKEYELINIFDAEVLFHHIYNSKDVKNRTKDIVKHFIYSLVYGGLRYQKLDSCNIQDDVDNLINILNKNIIKTFNWYIIEKMKSQNVENTEFFCELFIEDSLKLNGENSITYKLQQLDVENIFHQLKFDIFW